MDTKNIIAAISLSAAVIILYGLFFAPDPQISNNKEKINNKNEILQNSEAPKLEQKEEIIKISREDAIKKNERITFENNNIKGSISLTGVTIDDLTFKKYTETLNGKDKIILLHPKKIDKGYYVETGWATTNKNIDVPNTKSNWLVEGNNKLTPNSPIKLVWTNDQNIKFEKKQKYYYNNMSIGKIFNINNEFNN